MIYTWMQLNWKLARTQQKWELKNKNPSYYIFELNNFLTNYEMNLSGKLGHS